MNTYTYQHSIQFNYVYDIPVAHNVVLRLILGRNVEQQIFNVETTLLISTSGKQLIFNVVSTSDFNLESTLDFNVETTSNLNVGFQR